MSFLEFSSGKENLIKANCKKLQFCIIRTTVYNTKLVVVTQDEIEITVYFIRNKIKVKVLKK